MANVDICISARDNYSDAIVKMQTAQRSFANDMQGLQSKLNALNATKVKLKVDMQGAKKDLKDAQKAFQGTGDAMAKMRLESAQANYDNLSDNLSMVSKAAKDARKEIENLDSSRSKSENRANSSGGKSGMAETTGAPGIMSRLGQAGAYSMIGNIMSNAANTYVSSAFGEEAATYFGSALSGAASGASIGTMIAPGIGTAIGAVAGTAAGVVSGAIENFKKEDDAFKSAVQGEYNRVSEIQANAMQNGSNVAASREQTRNAFEVKIGADKTAELMPQIQEFSNLTPFTFDQISGYTNQLLSYGVAYEDVMNRTKQLGDLSEGNVSKLDSITRAYGKMSSKGKVSLEELNMMTEAGVPILKELASVMGISTDALYEKISKGAVKLDVVNTAIERMTSEGGQFNGMLEKMSKSYNGLVSTAKGLNDNLDDAMGEGYNEKRKEGLKADIDFKSGAMGEEMKNAYRLMGEWQAELENQREKKLRDTMVNVMTSKEYLAAEAEGNGAEMGRIMYQAKTAAEVAFREGPEYQQQLAAEQAAVQGIQGEMADSYENFGRTMALAFNKGLNSVPKDFSSFAPSYIMPGPSTGTKSEGGKKKAFGMNRVPYNDYPAILHEGERVLTASQARQQSAPPQITIHVSGNTVRSDNDIDMIVNRIVAQLKTVSEGYVNA